ncbi:MAG TPA: replication-associated recombination protein A [Phycisphaerales bacterium]|nr:replication-associated recombination protein A [Phycisphaerales bacterium]
MADLWSGKREQARQRVEPLAVRMRPRTLEEFAGQQHILGEGKLLRRMLQADAITSMILHGPPGTGKTTLAELIARHTKRVFVRENAAQVGVKRIREICDEAQKRLELENKRTILFLDEIHRFTKAQQDVLLSDVERGLITLIGATTENPLFAVNSALVSRSTLFRLETLSEDDIVWSLRRAVAEKERGYGDLDLKVDDEALRVWAVKCDGDARRALTALEVAVESQRHQALGTGHQGNASANSTSAQSPVPSASAFHITRAIAEDSIQQKAAVYDGTGDGHYDAASAMIKSVRGSDPDAAVYWIAMMLEAGEDPRFIARRLAILASEDIGNADPRGIMVAAATWQLVERIGMPEARITLSQCACYLALAPKSNASYVAIDAAMADVREGRTVPVPMHIKDGNVRKAGEMSAHGKREGSEQYKYAHTDGVPDPYLGMIGTQDYLGVEKTYYDPAGVGMEKVLKEALERARRVRQSPGS